MRRRNPRGDRSIRDAQRYGGSDPKLEAWRRGLPVPPDHSEFTPSVERLYGGWDGGSPLESPTEVRGVWRGWWDRPGEDGVDRAIMAFAAALLRDPEARQVQIVARRVQIVDWAKPQGQRIVGDFTVPEFWEQGGFLFQPLQEVVAAAYLDQPLRSWPLPAGKPIRGRWQRRQNPDEDMRELKRRARLGDAEAAERLRWSRARLGQHSDWPPATLNVLDEHRGFTIETYGRRMGHSTLWRPGDVLRGSTIGRLVSTEQSFYQLNNNVTLARYKVPGYRYTVVTWWDNATGERIA